MDTYFLVFGWLSSVKLNSKTSLGKLVPVAPILTCSNLSPVLSGDAER